MTDALEVVKLLQDFRSLRPWIVVDYVDPHFTAKSIRVGPNLLTNLDPPA